MTSEFKTDTQFVEKIYERIRAFNHEETTKETIKRSTTILQTGENFLKFCRLGKPHLRYVYVSDDEKNIYWCEKKDNNRKSNIKSIRCEDIIDIKVGYNVTSVLKKHQIPIEFDDLIFSIIMKTRTLDLQATSSEIRNRWVKFLKIIHYEYEKRQKFKEVNNTQEELEKQQRIKEDLEEIWENDIMTNFSDHWDYHHHRPKFQSKKKDETEKVKSSQRKRSWVCKLGCCWN